MATGYVITAVQNMAVRNEVYETLTALSSINVEGFKRTDLPAAQEGNLSVRGNATAGNLTMGDANHTITTGSRLDLYFAYANGTIGARRGATAGTVAGTVVPFAGGSGNDLPVVGTTVNAALPITANVSFNGNSIVGIGAKTDSGCATIVFNYANGTEIAAITFTNTSDTTANVYVWRSDSGVTNPLGTAVVASCYVSHGDSDGVGGVTMDVPHN